MTTTTKRASATGGTAAGTRAESAAAGDTAETTARGKAAGLLGCRPLCFISLAFTLRLMLLIAARATRLAPRCLALQLYRQASNVLPAPVCLGCTACSSMIVTARPLYLHMTMFGSHTGSAHWHARSKPLAFFCLDTCLRRSPESGEPEEGEV